MQPIDEKSLQGKVAVVTGASRGAGRGIALVLGDAGATVYVTGRSIRGEQTASHLPGTNIEETADMIAAHGGKAIPVRVDHTVDAQVEALFARVREEQGRLDILVNNAWGGYEVDNNAGMLKPFWEQPLQRWHKMIGAGLNAALVSSYFAAPLLIATGSGLIVNTTVGMDLESIDRRYIGVFYWLSKLAINRLAYGMAVDLRPHNVAAVALSLQWMRTEGVMDMVAKGVHSLADVAGIHSPEFGGRAVAALATDPHILDKTGQLLEVEEVSKEYGFTDIPFKP